MMLIENPETGTEHIVLTINITHFSSGDKIIDSNIACNSLYIRDPQSFLWEDILPTDELSKHDRVSEYKSSDEVDTDCICGHCLRASASSILHKYESSSLDVDYRSEDHTNEVTLRDGFTTIKTVTDLIEIKELKEMK